MTTHRDTRASRTEKRARTETTTRTRTKNKTRADQLEHEATRHETKERRTTRSRAAHLCITIPRWPAASGRASDAAPAGDRHCKIGSGLKSQRRRWMRC